MVTVLLMFTGAITHVLDVDRLYTVALALTLMIGFGCAVAVLVPIFIAIFSRDMDRSRQVPVLAAVLVQ